MTIGSSDASDGTPRVDPGRLWASLGEISRIGATAAGGLHRLAASREDGQARDLVVAAARAIGCRVLVDVVGNTFLTRPAADPGAAGAPGVLVGSHLDSQPSAGRYDGTYGVMAGLEVLRALDDASARTRRDITLAIWTNEEGARFAPAMMGSAVFAGRLPAEAALAARDEAGETLRDGLAAIGYLGDEEVVPSGFAHYLEAHIEQGPILERAGTPIGVVTGVQAQYWVAVRIRGERAHAGTFPLELRHDALVAAADVVTAVRIVGLARPGVGRATVGRLSVAPNSPNVVPGEVELVVELRHPDAAELDAMLADVDDALHLVGDRHGVGIGTERLLSSAPVGFDPVVVAAVQAAADRLGLRSSRMISGAGHDAVPVSAVVPAGMVFVPCHRGISHAEVESMTAQWAADGAAVLLETVLALTG